MDQFQHGSACEMFYDTLVMSPYTEDYELAISRSISEYRPSIPGGVVRRRAGHGDARIVLSGGAMTDSSDLPIWELFQQLDPAYWAMLPGGDAYAYPAYVGRSIGENQQRISGDDIVRLPLALVSAREFYRGFVALPRRTEDTPGSDSGDAIDTGVALTADGLSAWLWVFGMGGTDPEIDVVVEDSADGLAWDPLVTFATIEDDSGVWAESVSGDVRQHLRVRWDLNGVLNPVAEFAVIVVRH
jgi:hypothetical protein